MVPEEMMSLEGRASGGVDARRMRRLSVVGYGAMALGAVLYIVALWVQVYVDTRRMGQVSIDVFSESHRHWRLRTTLVFLIWTVLGGLTLPFGVGWLFLIPAYLWYCYRTLKGLIWFLLRRPIGRASGASARETAQSALSRTAEPAIR